MGTEPIYATLGKAIARLRAKSGMTQQNLADALGISRASVANIERGEQRVYLDQALAFVDVFNLSSLDELLAGAGLEKKASLSINLSGDHLKRLQKRQVKTLLERYLGSA